MIIMFIEIFRDPTKFQASNSQLKNVEVNKKSSNSEAKFLRLYNMIIMISINCRVCLIVEDFCSCVSCGFSF